MRSTHGVTAKVLITTRLLSILTRSSPFHSSHRNRGSRGEGTCINIRDPRPRTPSIAATHSHSVYTPARGRRQTGRGRGGPKVWTRKTLSRSELKLFTTRHWSRNLPHRIFDIAAAYDARCRCRLRCRFTATIITMPHIIVMPTRGPTISYVAIPTTMTQHPVRPPCRPSTAKRRLYLLQGHQADSDNNPRSTSMPIPHLTTRTQRPG